MGSIIQSAAQAAALWPRFGLRAEHELLDESGLPSMKGNPKQGIALRRRGAMCWGGEIKTGSRLSRNP
jgi:hypothetical protein